MLVGYVGFPVGSRVRCGDRFPDEALRGLLGTVVCPVPDDYRRPGWRGRLSSTDVLVLLDEDPRDVDMFKRWSFIIPTSFLERVPDPNPKYTVEEIVERFVR